VPRALDHLEGFGVREAALLGETVAKLLHLDRRWEIGQQDPAREERFPCVGDRLPRLGQVEDDPVDLPLVDPLVDVADLDLVVRAFPEVPAHRPGAARSEVLPHLVGDHPARRADRLQQLDGQGAPADAGLDHSRPGEDVRPHQDGARILRIDDLGVPLLVHDELDVGGAEGAVLVAHSRPGPAAVLPADQVVVLEVPLVGAENLSRGQGDQVLFALGRDEKDVLAFPERPTTEPSAASASVPAPASGPAPAPVFASAPGHPAAPFERSSRRFRTSSFRRQ